MRRYLSRSRADAAGAILAAAFAILLYAGGLKGGFVSDDWPIVVENPLVRDASPARLLASPYWRGHLSNYRPLTVASFALDVRLWGVKPLPLHCVNVALHAASSALVVLLAGAFGLAAAPAALAGLAFAALPVHAEAVDWISGRSELLAAFFVLAAWLSLYRCRSAGRACLGLALFALALLSKESAVPLPAAFALSELAAEPGSVKEVFKRRGLLWLSLLAVVGLYLEWRRLILGSAILPEDAYFFHGAFWPAVPLTMARFFALRWLGGLATGLGLCAEYGRPDFPDSTGSDWAAWLALAGALALAAWAARDFLAKRSRASLAVLVFLIFALPLLNLLFPLVVLGADRLMYLPSVGFCLLLGALWPAERRRRAAAAAACAALAVWAVQTGGRHRVWLSDDSLWTQTRACAPGSPKTLLWLGRESDLQGRHPQARAYYERALAIQPGLEHAAFDEARSFFEEGKLSQAESGARALIGRRPPGTASTWCLLGVIAEAQGRPAQAARDYRNALKLDPGYDLARRNLGLLLLRTGHFAKMGPE